MKFIILIILSSIIFSCSIAPESNSIGIPIVSSKQEAVQWVYDNIAGKSDMLAHGVQDYWQSPEETLIRKTGDCECRNILLWEILRYNKLDNVNTVLAMISMKHDDGKTSGHAVLFDGEYYYDSSYNQITKNLRDITFPTDHGIVLADHVDDLLTWDMVSGHIQTWDMPK